MMKAARAESSVFKIGELVALELKIK